MPPGSLPRHPREEAKPGTNKYKDIVCSGRIWLQHKPSSYRGHGYSNRLLPCRGCTTVTLHARIPGSRTPYSGMSDQGYPTQHSPSYDSSERPRRSTALRQGGHGPITPRSPGRCEDGGYHATLSWMRIRPCRNAELDVFQSFRTRLRRGGAHTRNPTYR